MTIALIAKLIVDHIPSLRDEILHQIPTEMCKARIRYDLMNQIEKEKYKNHQGE